VEPHIGILERCSAHGAIFLDEIGEVSPSLQIKLLTVLQERSFTPVGSHEQKAFRGRVIAATNRSIDRLQGPHGLRPDFYYRLSSDVIEMPSLRARLESEPDELADLIDHLVTRMTGDPVPDVRAFIHERLMRDLPPGYAWPGNVRELEQAVRRVLLTGRYDPPAEAQPAGPAADLAAGLRAGTFTAAALLGLYARQLYASLGTYEAVAARLQLDRRTVRKYIADVRPPEHPADARE